MSLCVAHVPTPVGPLRLEAGPRGLVRAAFVEPFELAPQPVAPPVHGHAAVHWLPSSAPDVNPERVLEAARELLGDLGGASRPLPLAPVGTDFQRDVWEALVAIPRGSTQTYRAIAEALGRPSASRAIGAAIARNPFALLIPCHRVVGSRGALTGYAWGLPRKAALLALEGATVL